MVSLKTIVSIAVVAMTQTSTAMPAVEPRQGSCSPAADDCPAGQECVNINSCGGLLPCHAPAIFACQDAPAEKRDLDARSANCMPGGDDCPEGQACVQINYCGPACAAPAIFGCQ